MKENKKIENFLKICFKENIPLIVSSERVFSSKLS